ncbi:hypothetical protein [Methylobacter svalbardensis]|uniref:DinB/UmuC family translesion DNA polymerase n=1 Tax=Methylobacter svalbardensis TaxID=3080016 RepID=UPI0030EC2412
MTGCITVFIRTSPFNPQEPQYQRAASIKFDAATQDTRTLIGTANCLLTEIFKAGYGYLMCVLTQPGPSAVIHLASNSVLCATGSCLKPVI